jgi:hypothetical protein
MIPVAAAPSKLREQTDLALLQRLFAVSGTPLREPHAGPHLPPGRSVAPQVCAETPEDAAGEMVAADVRACPETYVCEYRVDLRKERTAEYRTFVVSRSSAHVSGMPPSRGSASGAGRAAGRGRIVGRAPHHRLSSR